MDNVTSSGGEDGWINSEDDMHGENIVIKVEPMDEEDLNDAPQNDETGVAPDVHGGCSARVKAERTAEDYNHPSQQQRSMNNIPNAGEDNPETVPIVEPYTSVETGEEAGEYTVVVEVDEVVPKTEPDSDEDQGCCNDEQQNDSKTGTGVRCDPVMLTDTQNYGMIRQDTGNAHSMNSTGICGLEKVDTESTEVGTYEQDSLPTGFSQNLHSCNGETFTEVDVPERVERRHKEEKRHHCGICRKSFDRPSGLKRHERIHTGERPYHCRYCEKAFNSFSGVKKHERIHTGERPYQCKYCEKTFVQSAGLWQHERLHTGEKPHLCRYCNKSFLQPRFVRLHERVHTREKPHSCNFCERSFANKGNLKDHVRIHTGERPYQCEHCGKCFNRSGTLKQHERIHTGEKPYNCQYCDRAFSLGVNRKKHEKICKVGTSISITV